MENVGAVGRLYPSVAEVRNSYYALFGWRWNPFSSVRLSDPELFVAPYDVVLEIDDYIKARERHILITSKSPGMGKTTLLELIYGDLLELSRRGDPEYMFFPVMVSQSKLYVRQMAEVLARKLRVPYPRSANAEDIYTLIKYDIMLRYLLSKHLTLIFIDDFGENDVEVFIKVKEVGDLTLKDAKRFVLEEEDEFKRFLKLKGLKLSGEELAKVRRIAEEGDEDQMICMLILTGTKTHVIGLREGVPHLYDRCWEVELEPLSDEGVREFIGRRLYWASGRLKEFDESNFEIYPFKDDAVPLLRRKSKGVGRSLRLLCNQAVFVAANRFKDGGSPEIGRGIVEVLPDIEDVSE